MRAFPTLHEVSLRILNGEDGSMERMPGWPADYQSSQAYEYDTLNLNKSYLH